MTDVIRLTGISLEGSHGVHPHEKTTAQRFVVDVAVWLDTSPAGRTDDLADTVDYSAVAATVAEVVGGPTRNLIESLAHDIARRVMAMYLVEGVEVTVHKPSADVGITCDDVSVSVALSRQEAPSRAGLSRPRDPSGEGNA